MTHLQFFLCRCAALLSVFGALVACDPSALGRGAFDDPAIVQLSISSIEPSEGSVGTEVVLLGTGFEEGLLILFEDTLAPIATLEASQVVVTAPQRAGLGPVDVVAVLDDTRVVFPDGYTYIEGHGSNPSNTTTGDSQGDSGIGSTADRTTTDSGKSSTPTTADTALPELPSGVVQLVHMQAACPACLGLTNELQIYAEVAFHEPTPAGWLDWMPAVGSCALNPANAPIASDYIDVGEWVYLETGASSLGLYRQLGDSGAVYRIDGLSTTQFLRTAFYDLIVPDGGAYGPFELADAALTPTGFATIEPEALLLSNPLAAFSAGISKSTANTIRWSPAGTGTFLVMVDVYDRFGYPTGDLVVCHGNDSGSLVLPGAYFSSYANGSLLVVYMVRTEHVITGLGGDVRMEGVAQMGVIGTATLVP